MRSSSIDVASKFGIGRAVRFGIWSRDVCALLFDLHPMERAAKRTETRRHARYKVSKGALQCGKVSHPSVDCRVLRRRS